MRVLRVMSLVRLDELYPGDTFMCNKDTYIVATAKDIDRDVTLCVRLDTGDVHWFNPSMLVEKVDGEFVPLQITGGDTE